MLMLQMRKWRLREEKWPELCPISAEPLLESSLLTGHQHKWGGNDQV